MSERRAAGLRAFPARIGAGGRFQARPDGTGVPLPAGPARPISGAMARRGRSGVWQEGDGASVRPPVLCPLCERPIPPGARQSRHHLVPKLKGGARGETVRLHQVCHAAIHARHGEAALARHLADVASLRADPEIARFLAWVRAKPDDFHASTRSTRERRSERKRVRP